MQTRLRQQLLSTSLFCALLAGQAAPALRADSPKPAGAKAAAAPEPARDSVETARRAEVVASFEAGPGGASGQVTVGQLEDSAAAGGGGPRAGDQAALKTLLDRSLRFELLAAEAERAGYGKNSTVVQAVKQNAVQAMLKRDVDANVTPKAVPVADVKQYYDQHTDEFVRPELRRASQVVLATEAEAKALLPEAKAADMRAFRELARLRSKDETSKLRGGDLRYFDAKGKPEEPGTNLEPAIAKAAFALKAVGDTSTVVKTAAGFAIVKLTGLRAAHEEKLKDVEQRIRMRLWRERREATIDGMVAELRKQANPTTRPELIDAIDFGPEPATPPNAGLPAGFPHTKPPAVPTPKE